MHAEESLWHNLMYASALGYRISSKPISSRIVICAAVVEVSSKVVINLSRYSIALSNSLLSSSAACIVLISIVACHNDFAAYFRLYSRFHIPSPNKDIPLLVIRRKVFFTSDTLNL